MVHRGLGGDVGWLPPPLLAGDLRTKQLTCRAGLSQYNNYSSADEGSGESARPGSVSLLLTVILG